MHGVYQGIDLPRMGQGFYRINTHNKVGGKIFSRKIKGWGKLDPNKCAKQLGIFQSSVIVKYPQKNAVGKGIIKNDGTGKEFICYRGSQMLKLLMQKTRDFESD